METVALYAGSFDPITNGHIDILERSAHLFSRVVITVAVNKNKKGVFSVDERIALIKQCLEGKDWAANVSVTQFSGLLVDYAREIKANTLIRGVRQASDFDYEFRMALANKKLAPEIETLFMMPDERYTFVSASLVREIAYWGGDVSSFVPPVIEKALIQKMSARD